MFWRALVSGQLGRAMRQARTGRQLRRPSEPLRLHVGCGKKRFEGFVNIDCNPSLATDYVCDVARLPCPAESVERIEAYHLIEHVPWPQVETLLAAWLRLLAPGGRLVLECPDLDAAVREYLAGDVERLYSIYGRQRFPGDAHHWGYNVERLTRLLESVGFIDAVAVSPQDYHKDHEPCLRVEAVKPSHAETSQTTDTACNMVLPAQAA